jgi:threonine dehydrogenase-like Zn-dependent dehydrogenase
MRAVALDFARRALLEREIPEPRIARDDQVLFRVEEVGVCGTDRELASFRLGYPPDGESFLVLGHEAAGRVVEVGAAVASLRRGDCVVPMIRRGCSPLCACCARRRSDLCVSGNYRERGIFGLHGYFCEMAVDSERDLVAVPERLVEFAVLAEPLSVVEKAIQTAMKFREEPPVSAGVLGAGPVGLLAAMALRARGLDVWLYSLEAVDHPRAKLAEQIGARYVRSLDWQADIVVEATGAAQAAFAAIRCLTPLGVCALLGTDTGEGHVSFRDLVVGNRIVFGSVNASPEAFALAIGDLGRFDPAMLRRLIERRPFSAFPDSIAAPSSATAKIAHVLHWKN